MAQFIGKKVVVTLKAGRKIQGIVGQVLADSAAPQLVLSNGEYNNAQCRQAMEQVK